MPLNKNMSHEEKVKELMQAYKEKGKIGNTTPKDEEDAMKIANAIAYSSESLDFNVSASKSNTKIMKEQLDKIKDLLENGFPVLEGAMTSNTRYDQESQNDQTLKVEDDKSFEEDRLDLEEILTMSPSYKKNYVKRVVNTINKMIDGVADIDDLTKAVKKRKKIIK